MAIYIKTENPKELLEKIKAKISEHYWSEWKIDKDGDFANQYDYMEKAWLKPKIMPKNLVMGIIGRKDMDMTTNTYAYFHSQFCKFILEKFDNDIISIRVTPQMVEGIDKF